MKQRFTLDRQSFEQFLAAISLFQPLQRAAAKNGGSPLLLSLLETLQGTDSGTLQLQDALERVTELTLRVVGGETAILWLFRQNSGTPELTSRAVAGSNIDDAGMVAALQARLQSGGAFENYPPAKLDLTRSIADGRQNFGSALAVAILPGKQIAGSLAVIDHRPAAFRENHYSNLRLLAGLAQYILVTRASEHELQGSSGFMPGADWAAPIRKASEEFLAARGAKESFIFAAPAPDRRSLPIETPPENSVRNDEREIQQPEPSKSAPEVWGNGVRDALFANEGKAVFTFAEINRMRQTLRSQVQRFFDAARDVLPRSYTIRVNWHTFSQGMQALVVLAIIAFFTGMLTGSSPAYRGSSLSTTAEASVVQPASGISTMTAMDAPGTVLASTRGVAERPRVTSHQRITDHDTEERIAEMSRFELRSLRRSAESGDDEAALQLGMLYETGRVVQQNCANAAKWVRRAADSGNPAAEYNLGLRYRDGDGLAADPSQAAEWLRKAAAHKNRTAAAALNELSARSAAPPISSH
jgi:hypothetical protein